LKLLLISGINDLRLRFGSTGEVTGLSQESWVSTSSHPLPDNRIVDGFSGDWSQAVWFQNVVFPCKIWVT
jgi:hypothetical protein